MVGAYSVPINSDMDRHMSVTIILLAGLAISLAANCLVFVLLTRYISRQLQRSQKVV